MDEETRSYSALLHELKNPLFAIERLSDILLEKDDLSKDTKRKLRLIHSSVGEAFGYLEDLDFSSPPALAQNFSFEPVDITALAIQVTESLQPHAEYKDQDLRCVGLKGEALVLGDEVRLREAMKNLVNNALKYSPRGETVRVRVVQSESEVRFSVSDNGPGLSKSDLSHLFEPFRRLTNQPTDGEKSVGLGLYLVREIVNRHDGDVDVETSEGEGSTFSLIFPSASSVREPSSSTS